MSAIFRSLGVDVKLDAPLPEGISGQLAKENGRFVAATSNSEHEYRQRFTLAHELGHYILHRSLIGEGLDDDKMYRSTSEGNYYNTAIKQRHERQANSFAAKVLMPKAKLSEIFKEAKAQGKTLTLKEISRKFKVSESAAKWRIVNLGWRHKLDSADLD